MSLQFLVGHGQSIWNLQNRFTGWLGFPPGQQGRPYGRLRHNRHCARTVRVHEQGGEGDEHHTRPTTMRKRRNFAAAWSGWAQILYSPCLKNRGY